MGGSSSSKSTTSNTNTSIDARLASGEGSSLNATQVFGNNNTVLDGGAIQNAFDFAKDMGSSMLEQITVSQNMANQNTKQAFAFADNMKAGENERMFTKLMPYLVVAVGIMAVAYIFAPTKKQGRRRR